MKKFVSDSSKKTLKKQLISGGVYIALSAVAVAVTVNTAVSLLSKNLPVTENDTSLSDISSDLPSLPDNFTLPKIPDSSSGSVTVSDSKEGVNSLVIEDDLYIGIQDEIASDKDEETPSPEEIVNPTPELPFDEIDGAKANSEISNVTVEEIGEKEFIKPCDGFVTTQHSVDVPVYSPTLGDFRTHSGVDIAADKGAVVKSARSGKVTEIYTDDLYGNTVVTVCEDGYSVVYSNLSPILSEGIEKDVEISVGTVIGCVGESAIAEAGQESHLHFEILKDGIPTDPEELVDF